MAGDRVGAGEYAARVNAAADLVEAGVPVAEAARVLAGRFGCSVRQARRYAEHAARAGRTGVPPDMVVFTVKLPAGLAARVRAHARQAGLTISAVVAQALEEFLARGHRAEEGPDDRVADRGAARARRAEPA
jgi:predicted transcriptional regulator